MSSAAGGAARFWRRHHVRAVVVSALLVTLACVAATALPPSARALARIVIISPHRYQVVQRDAAGRAAITVVGRRLGIEGPVEVRWGTGGWVRASCSGTGRFKVRLPDLAAGQATVVVRAARRHDVAAKVPLVGVGDIYVIAGQSNASGRGERLNRARNPTLSAALFGNDDAWGPLVDPTDSPVRQVDRVSKDIDAAGSVWPLVATRVMAREAVPVAFVPCASGSTSIAEWQMDPSAPASPATLFGSMVRRVRAVGGRVRAILFWQGELDARMLVPRDTYAASLVRFAADVKAATGAPVVPAQMGDFTFQRWTAEGVDAIRMAQEDVMLTPAAAENAVATGPALYDIDLAPGWHPITDAQSAAVARRWTAAIRTGVLGAESHQSPRLTGAAYDGATTITLTLSVVAGALAPGPAEGIVVDAAGQPVLVTDALVVPPDRVVLHLAAPVAPEDLQSLTVSLGSGRDGAGRSVPAEDSAWRLPAWPFAAEPVATPGGKSTSRVSSPSAGPFDQSAASP